MRSRSPSRHLTPFFLSAVLFAPLAASAEDIQGVQPAAIDQPRINLVLSRRPNGPALSTKPGPDENSNIEAFLDTGASSVAISLNTAQQLSIAREQDPAGQTRFVDIGVGGQSTFAVSELLFLSITPGDTRTIGPIRTEIGPLEGPKNILDSLVLGDLDVVGMPAMQGKIVVMDLKDANQFTDKIHTYVYNSRSSAAAIPPATRHVKLSYASFQRFTETIPPQDAGPAIFPNPFIGPAPFKSPGADKTPPLLVKYKGKSSAGSWLLDTGSAASMISLAQAAALGITYTPNTLGTDHPTLLGIPPDRQFTMTVGGIGGSKKTAGVYLDSLTLHTREGKPLVFINAPVLVNDITVKDNAGKDFTLEGVFGMNFLVATAKLDESTLLPDFDKLTPSPFRYIIFDEPGGTLGLQ